MTIAPIRTGVALAALLAGGCTTQIATRPDLTMTAPNGAMIGIPYNLPMLQYKIDVTRTLSACPSRVMMPAEQEAANRQELFVDPTLAFAIKVVAAPRYVRGETYIVDYRPLSSMLKQTSFEMTTFAGTGNLKTINVSADDKSGDVLKAAAQIGLSVAALAGGGPIGATLVTAGTVAAAGGAGDSGGGGAKAQGVGSAAARAEAARQALRDRDDEALKALVAASSKPGLFIDCAPSARAVLTERAKQEQNVGDATAKLTALTRTVGNAALLAGVQGMPPAGKATYAQTLDDALTKQDAAQEALRLATEAKAKADGAMAEAEEYVWPNRLPNTDGLLPVSGATRASFAANLSPGPVFSQHVLDPAAFARKLAELRARDASRFKRLKQRYEILDNYLLPNGAAPVVVESVRTQACQAGSSNLEIDSCLTALLDLHAQLRTVERDDSAFIGGAPCQSADGFPTLACRKPLTIPATLVPDATPARGPREPTRPPHILPEPEIVDAREAGSAGTGLIKGGVFVRQPVEGRLFVCRGRDCDANSAANLLTVDPKAEPTMAPQLGQLRFLPFKNGPFQSNQLALELAADGTIANFAYKDKAATAAVAAASVADILKQVDDDRTKRRADAATAETQSVASLQAQIDMLTKQAQLIALQTPKSADQQLAASTLVDINAQTALLEAKLAKQKAHNELVAAGGDDN